MISLKLTEDGSHTLFSEQFAEQYHSSFGAIAESKYVYIETGLKSCNSNIINVLEMGFGTGLNAFLTFLYAAESQKTINYFSVEKFPVEISVIEKLNFCEFLENKHIFLELHRCKWNEKVVLSKNFSLTKILGDICDISLPQNIDVVFFDAFSPDKQPSLWNEKIFQKIYNSMNINGILTTYSSKGIVKQALRNVGFEVKRIKGIGNKRHVLKVLKNFC